MAIIYMVIDYYMYVRNNISDPGGIPKYVGNTAGFIYSLRDVEC
jgi:hypothetical protein